MLNQHDVAGHLCKLNITKIMLSDWSVFYHVIEAEDVNENIIHNLFTSMLYFSLALLLSSILWSVFASFVD